MSDETIAAGGSVGKKTRSGWKEPLGIEIEAEIMARWVRLQKKIRQKDLGKVEAYQLIAEALDIKDWHTVAGVIYRHRPTLHIAQIKLKAAAAMLVDRIVEKASVDQAIDILSRPNMGVLAPMKTSGGGGGGFFLSVQADSCGAVKVGMMAGPVQMPGLPPAEVIDEADLPEEESTDDDWTPFGQSDKQRLIASAREKLAEARALTGQGNPGRPDHPDTENGSVQGADEESQGAAIEEV